MLMEEPRRPHFFKVLVGDFARRIEIPRAFLCHISGKGSRTSDTPVASSTEVILKNAEEKTWVVELEEIDGHRFLTTGWPKFVEDNCLGQGEFLVFKCDVNMHFVVLVFGVNAVEKEVWSSGSGARATGNLEGKLPCDISPSSKRGHSGDKLTEAAKSLTHGHPQSVTLQSTQGDEHISSQDTIGFLDLHEVGCSHDELETYMPLKGPMDNDKAKAIAKVIGALNMDKLTVDLFCATLCLYKWNVDAAAQDFNICRGKPQMPEQSLRQKLVSHFNFVKEQLRHFFPPDDNSSAPIHERRKNNLEEHNLSNQPPQCDLTPVKRKLVDGYESCDLSHKRRTCKLIRGSLQIPTLRRSPRLAHMNNTCINTDNILKERSEAPESLPVLANQVKDRADKSFFLHERQNRVLKGVREEIIGSFSQNFSNLEPTRSEVGLGEEHGRTQGESERKVDQRNDGENSKEQKKRNGLETSVSLTSAGCIETQSMPTNCELTSYSGVTELSFMWKPSQSGNALEKILLDIERDNFVNTIVHVQKIIQNNLLDVQTADLIEAIVRIGILKWHSCLQDSNAQRIVNALLEYSNKVKEQQNFNTEVRKKEFSAKLQDHLKWQLKELETGYASLELDYTNATAYASICFSAWEERKQKLHCIQNDPDGLQQALRTKEDELQNLRHQVSEHETVYQKSIMEKVRVKMALKSYQETLDEIKRRLASTEPGSIDVEALVKVEMDNMSKEIEFSKGNLLNINFKKE
ncbi:hypothetical protein ACP70R_038243 [Stipagrostis hirtigluma subsp. patula]